MKTVRMLFALFLPLALWGCALGEGDVVQRYVLPTPPVVLKNAPRPLKLQVRAVDVAAGLDTSRIALIKNDTRMNYLEGARWAESLPEMLQGIWIDILRKSRLTASVSNDFSTVKPDRVLHITANAFHVIKEGGDMSVRIEYAAELSAPGANDVFASEDITVIKKAPAQDIDSLMHVFQAANAEAMNGLILKLAKDIK